MRRDIARGIDPVAEKKKVEDPVPTFADAARRVHEEQKATWKNGKHQVQWITTLETYAFPFFGDRLVNAIEGPDIRKALLPIWLSKPETARRVRQRVGAVLDWSYVNGYKRTDFLEKRRALMRGCPNRPGPQCHVGTHERLRWAVGASSKDGA